MFELVQCKQSGITNETLNFDQMIRRFKGTAVEGAVNGWIGTCRSGETLKLAISNIVIVCIE